MPHYGVAVSTVVLALLLTLLLQPLLGSKVFPLYYAAVAISSWYGGLGPGLLATFLSTLAISYFSIAPVYSPAVSRLDDFLRLGAFFIVTLLISSLNSDLRTAKQRVQVSLGKLRASEERYRHLIDTAYEGIWTLDADGRTDYVNQRMAQMLGYSVEEMLDRSVFDFMDEVSRTEAQQSIERYKQGTREQRDLRFRRKDGSDLWAIVSANPILNDGSEFVGTFAMVTDVTGRKQAEEALRNREDELRLITNTVPVLISFIDSEQRYRFNNKAYEEWFGHSTTAVYGKHLSEVLGESAYETIRPYVEAVLLGQQVTYESQVSYKDGGTRYINATYIPQFGEQGNVEGFVALVSDITGRKWAEQEREQLLTREQAARVEAEAAREQVSKILESITDGFVAFDREWRFTYLNHEGTLTIGRPLEELLGKNLWEEFPELADTSFGQLYQRAVAEGVPLELEDYYPPFDAWFAVRAYPSEAGLSLYFRNIGDRKRLERELREQGARMQRLIDSNVIGVIFVNFSGDITEANDAFLEMVGYTQEDAHSGNLRWLEMTPLEYRLQDERALEEIKQTGACAPFEKEYFRKDGSRVPILLGVALLPDSQTCVCFVLDLTERKQAESALRESEERYRSLVAATTSMVWTTNAEGAFVCPQPSWEAYTGQSWEEHRGWGWVQALHPDDREQVQALWTRSLAEQTIYKSEGQIWHAASGEYRYFMARGVPLLNSDGSVREWIGTVTDVHDRKQAEAEIRQLNESLEQRVKERTAQLEAANQELESFSYSVSHDLRAPLRHVSGFVDLLWKRVGSTALDEMSLRYLRIITETTQQAGTLIDDLLAFSRMGRAEMQHTTVNMDQLVREVQRTIELEASQRRIHWQIEKLPLVQGDPSMLRLVLHNLMENAVKYTYTRAQAEIEMGSTLSEHEAVFFVRDNGVGFDMRYVHKLFGVFQRLHSEPQVEGTGIGLANVRRIIHRHGGRTWAESTLNKGATFYFSLPKLAEEEE